MATESSRIALVVSKWGNSLAVRLPAESAKRIGVREGDTLIAEVMSDGRMLLAPLGRSVGKTESNRLRRFLARQQVSAPIVDEMRREARY